MTHHEHHHDSHRDTTRSNTGHHDHASHADVYRRKFFVVAVVAGPVIWSSMSFSMLLGYSLPEIIGVTLIAPLGGTFVFLWGGWPFLSGATRELRTKRPGMMTLISLAITVAFFSSLGASVGVLPVELDFWWELVLLVVVMLFGHWIEMKSLAKTTSALDSLAALLPDEAEVVVGDDTKRVSPSDLVTGDVVVVRPGGRIPADGVITSGTASLDESMLTGESRAVVKEPGDKVVAGTVSTDSSLRVEVQAVGEDTALAGIHRLVEQAQMSSSKAQRLADRAAALLFWFALAAAAITLTVWMSLGQTDVAIVRAITVLVIACPHALGLAIPLVVSISTERAAKAGVLIKDRLALERMRAVDTVLFDKTGTLTSGEPKVLEVYAVEPHTANDVVMRAAAAESESEHPLARAIVRYAIDNNVELLPAQDTTSSPAVGVTARVNGDIVRVGGPYLLEEEGLEPLDISRAWSGEGSTVLHVLVDGKIIGALSVVDGVRPESEAAIDALHLLRHEVVMITGDAEAVAQSVATRLGIDRVFAGVRPEDKAEKVRGLQAEGKTVAMVGDGVNDAPALAQADVGIAIGAGTDVAIASAGVTLASSDPRSVLSIHVLSKASYRKMKQNLWWAAGYNLAAVPLAAGVLAPVGVVLPMSVGALLMSLSTLVVAANAQILRRLDLSPDVVAPATKRADDANATA